MRSEIRNMRKMKSKQEGEIISFDSPDAWRKWLDKNHTSSVGIWLRFFKMGSGVASVTYDEALDEAICYGWIDGQLKPYDKKSWIRKFTPRRPNSMWSKRNIDKVARLRKEGRMKRAGLREAEEARTDGRWDMAYDPGSKMEMPADFLNRLSRSKRATVFFKTLNKANTYAIAWRLQTARKPETRERRMAEILAMLEREEKFHS